MVGQDHFSCRPSEHAIRSQHRATVWSISNMHANLAMRQHIAAPARLSAGRRGARILSRSSAVQPRASALQASELQAIGKALQEARSLPPSQRQEALQSAGRVVKEKLNSMRAGDETMLWRSFEGRTKRRTARGHLHLSCGYVSGTV